MKQSYVIVGVVIGLLLLVNMNYKKEAMVSLGGTFTIPYNEYKVEIRTQNNFYKTTCETSSNLIFPCSSINHNLIGTDSYGCNIYTYNRAYAECEASGCPGTDLATCDDVGDSCTSVCQRTEDWGCSWSVCTGNDIKLFKESDVLVTVDSRKHTSVSGWNAIVDVYINNVKVQHYGESTTHPEVPQYDRYDYNFMCSGSACNKDGVTVKYSRSSEDVSGTVTIPTDNVIIHFCIGQSLACKDLVDEYTTPYWVECTNTCPTNYVLNDATCECEATLYCGDGTCNGQETTSSCPADCHPAVYCGDGQCNNGETSSTCAQDCPSGPFCGDYICNNGESSSTCLGDCPVNPYCGDNVCNNGETTNSCAQDCPLSATCGDTICSNGETTVSCPADCPVVPFCGDNICNNAETSSNCITDCPVTNVCGDGTCSGTETHSSCAADCPATAYCGDGICSDGETTLCSDCDEEDSGIPTYLYIIGGVLLVLVLFSMMGGKRK